MHKFDLLMLDLDGTLIDNRFAIRENFNHSRRVYGYGATPDNIIDSMIGKPLVEMFERTLPESDRQLAPQLATIYRKRYQDTSHNGVVILDGVITQLDSLRRDGFKLAVATSKSNDVTCTLLERIGLQQYFDIITGYREGIRTKPHPDMILYIMGQLGIEPNRSVLIGDTPTDVVTARNSGVYSIAVTSSVQLGFTTAEDIYAAKPDVVINSLGELPSYIYL